VAVAGFSLRCQAIGVRGRVRDAHLDGSLEVSGTQGREGLRASAQEQGQESDAYSLDEPVWDGRFDVHKGGHGRRSFRALYVEHFLAPSLREGQVVVMDNLLGAHRPKRIRELIEARGAQLVFVPSYSPDLNPIEQAFSKIKSILRKRGARTHETLLEAMGEALGKVTPRDAAGWFEHCGYQVEVQYL
jgi:transposase